MRPLRSVRDTRASSFESSYSMSVTGRLTRMAGASPSGQGQRVAVAAAAAEAEHADDLRQAAGLLLQRLRGCRGLFDQRRVLLRHLVHLRDRLVDLLDARGLLLARRRDLAHDV